MLLSLSHCFVQLALTSLCSYLAEAEKVSFLLGVNAGDLLKSLLKPKIKVGADYVTQGRTKEQVCRHAHFNISYNVKT